MTYFIIRKRATEKNAGYVTFYAKTDIGLVLTERNLRQAATLNSTHIGTHPTERTKGAITSKIKHAIKLETSPARLAQLLQPSLAFCFSLQPVTAHRFYRATQSARYLLS